MGFPLNLSLVTRLLVSIQKGGKVFGIIYLVRIQNFLKN